MDFFNSSSFSPSALSLGPVCLLCPVVNLFKIPSQLSCKVSHGLDVSVFTYALPLYVLKIVGIQKGMNQVGITVRGLPCPTLIPKLRWVRGITVWWLHCEVPISSLSNHVLLQWSSLNQLLNHAKTFSNSFFFP